jgi:hypothetical protein
LGCIIKTQNKNNEALVVAAYVVNEVYIEDDLSECQIYEFSPKYGDDFVFIGMYYSGFSKGAAPYCFLLLLVPSVVLITCVDLDTNVRNAIIIYQVQFV